MLINGGVWAAAFDANAPVPVDISIVKLESGKGFAFQNSYGAAFYTYDRDRPNTSTCLDKCAEIWVPVYPSARNPADIGTTWKLVNRPDGTQQWAYNGRPLYTFGYAENAPSPTAKDTADHWHKLEP